MDSEIKLRHTKADYLLSTSYSSGEIFPVYTLQEKETEKRLKRDWKESLQSRRRLICVQICVLNAIAKSINTNWFAAALAPCTEKRLCDGIFEGNYSRFMWSLDFCDDLAFSLTSVIVCSDYLHKFIFALFDFWFGLLSFGSPVNLLLTYRLWTGNTFSLRISWISPGYHLDIFLIRRIYCVSFQRYLTRYLSINITLIKRSHKPLSFEW